MSHICKGKEYTVFGEGWVCRAEGSTDDWEECPVDALPSEVVEAGGALVARKAAGAAGALPPAAPPKITRKS